MTAERLMFREMEGRSIVMTAPFFFFCVLSSGSSKRNPLKGDFVRHNIRLMNRYFVYFCDKLIAGFKDEFTAICCAKCHRHSYAFISVIDATDGSLIYFWIY